MSNSDSGFRATGRIGEDGEPEVEVEFRNEEGGISVTLTTKGAILLGKAIARAILRATELEEN